VKAGVGISRQGAKIAKKDLGYFDMGATCASSDRAALHPLDALRPYGLWPCCRICGSLSDECEVMIMAKTVPIPPPGFDDLSLDEKVDYVQSLWDQLAAKPDEIPVPDWHRQILDERLAADRSNPQEGRP